MRAMASKNLIVFHCPSGGTGIRARLKIVSRKGCGFDSHLGHKLKNLQQKLRFFNLCPKQTNCFVCEVGIEKLLLIF